MKEIEKYFELDSRQRELFSKLPELYGYWNERVNVISRKDIDSLMLKHVLHSLALLKVCEFTSGAKIADVGCGGGFPTIPLAILFPEVQFTAADSIGKKITVVREISTALGLTNVKPVNARVESLPERFDYVVSRAVTDMKTFTGWIWNKIERGQHGTLPNGILYLKGGDLAEELALTGKRWDLYSISDLYDEDFFETKKVVYTKR